MLAASPVRSLGRTLSVLPLAVLFYGCSDASKPLAPRVPPKPNALAGPVLTVTNTDDAGPGSIRQTIIDAAPGSTIQFDAAIAAQTIVLSSGVLLVDKSLTIEGPPTGMTISGGLSSGVLRVDAISDLVLRNMSIVNGRAFRGAGVHVFGNATIDHSVIANNESTEPKPGGGGGVFVENPTSVVTIVNSTVSGNAAVHGGGGILSRGVLTIRNSTIADNVADAAGGIFITAGSFILRNSIIANNQDGAGSTANCFISSDADVVFAGRNLTNDDQCDPSMLVANPDLLPLGSNGGPTMTHALGPLSAAIEAGLSCTEANDQRYVARPQGTTCDIGAFEFPFGTFTLTIGPNVAVNAKTGVVTLTGTIACSKPTIVGQIDVEVSQTQKTTGRFTTIVKATGIADGLECQTGPSSWSVALAPQPPEKFTPGAATGTATISTFLGRFLPATVTSPLKLFQVK